MHHRRSLAFPAEGIGRSHGTGEEGTDRACRREGTACIRRFYSAFLAARCVKLASTLLTNVGLAFQPCMVLSGYAAGVKPTWMLEAVGLAANEWLNRVPSVPSPPSLSGRLSVKSPALTPFQEWIRDFLRSSGGSVMRERSVLIIQADANSRGR